jgi:ribosome-associated heat shock protein Hsp15
MEEPADVRIDKCLWAARVFKTRALALAACRGGHVKLDGHDVKPGRPVRVGDEYVVRTPGLTRTVRVVGVSDRRVGPKLVATLLEDRTPPEEIERARLSLAQQILTRPKGSGRPTKRERRQLDEWLPSE